MRFSNHFPNSSLSLGFCPACSVVLLGLRRIVPCRGKVVYVLCLAHALKRITALQLVKNHILSRFSMIHSSYSCWRSGYPLCVGCPCHVSHGFTFRSSPEGCRQVDCSHRCRRLLWCLLCCSPPQVLHRASKVDFSDSSRNGGFQTCLASFTCSNLLFYRRTLFVLFTTAELVPSWPKRNLWPYFTPLLSFSALKS